MKNCSKCKIDKEVVEFSKDNKSKDSLHSYCKTCKTTNTKSYYLNNLDKERKRGITKYSNNREYYQQKSIDYNHANTNKRRTWKTKRRADEVGATLKGFDDELLEIYKNRPDDYHVDYIVPLRGKNVCSLHVPWNLQYLTLEENLKKSNKLFV